MLLSVVSAGPVVEMPTTNVLKPAFLAASSAGGAPAESSAWAPIIPPPKVPPAPLAGHVGNPSVASRMNLGLLSVSVPRYAAAPVSAARVGVPLKPITPPFVLVAAMMAVVIAAPAPGAMSTAAVLVTPQAEAEVSGKNLRPQL